MALGAEMCSDWSMIKQLAAWCRADGEIVFAAVMRMVGRSAMVSATGVLEVGKPKAERAATARCRQGLWTLRSRKWL